MLLNNNWLKRKDEPKCQPTTHTHAHIYKLLVCNSDKLFVILINDSMAINTLNKLTCSTWRMIQIYIRMVCVCVPPTQQNTHAHTRQSQQ